MYLNWWFYISVLYQLLLVVGGLTLLLTLISIARSLRTIAENSGLKPYKRGGGVLDQDGYEPGEQQS